MKILLYSGSLVLLLLSCSNPEKPNESPEVAEQNTQWRKVMDIHDEVMPKTSQINKTARELRAVISQDSSQTEQLLPVITALDQAEEGMMEWMYAFKPLNRLRDSLDHKAIMKYLLEEEVRIQKVKEDMLTSLEKGQSTLKTYSSASP